MTFDDWKPARVEAEALAKRTGLDVAIRKVNEYGRTRFSVRFAAVQDSDYARAEIVKGASR